MQLSASLEPIALGDARKFKPLLALVWKMWILNFQKHQLLISDFFTQAKISNLNVLTKVSKWGAQKFSWNAETFTVLRKFVWCFYFINKRLSASWEPPCKTQLTAGTPRASFEPVSSHQQDFGIFYKAMDWGFENGKLLHFLVWTNRFFKWGTKYITF